MWEAIGIGVAVWFVGMIPTAFIVGRTRRKLTKAESEVIPASVDVAVITAWPLVLAAAPIAYVHRMATRPTKIPPAEGKPRGKLRPKL